MAIIYRKSKSEKAFGLEYEVVEMVDSGVPKRSKIVGARVWHRASMSVVQWRHSDGAGARQSGALSRYPAL